MTGPEQRAFSDEDLVRNLQRGDEQRDETVRRTLATLTQRERELVREAAIMGYVHGYMDQPYCERIPGDEHILRKVILGCVSFSERYPFIAAASDRIRKRGPRPRRS